jgi:hypothetical protein
VSIVRGFGRFWWDFIIGDDWKIAATVAFTLAVGAVVAAAVATGSSWLAPVLGLGVVLAFVTSLVADVRRG